MIRFACPKCRKYLSAPDEKAGLKCPCPGCGQRLRIPAAKKDKTMLGDLVPTATQLATRPMPFPPAPPAELLPEIRHRPPVLTIAMLGLLFVGVAVLATWVTARFVLVPVAPTPVAVSRTALVPLAPAELPPPGSPLLPPGKADRPPVEEQERPKAEQPKGRPIDIAVFFEHNAKWAAQLSAAQTNQILYQRLTKAWAAETQEKFLNRQVVVRGTMQYVRQHGLRTTPLYGSCQIGLACEQGVVTVYTSDEDFAAGLRQGQEVIMTGLLGFHGTETGRPLQPTYFFVGKAVPVK